MLVVVNARQRYASLEAFLCEQLYATGPAHVRQEGSVRPMIESYVELMRRSYEQLYAWEDDMIPCAIVYWGIGGITAATTGLQAMHQENTSWLEPNLDWETIANLRFDDGNPWVQFALHVNQALWEFWEEDFFILPFLHRSPLDAANGIRGTDLFTEMYTAPEKVKDLVDWCADWSIAIERYLAERDGHARGWGTGVWDTWLPEGAVFVNGDPVGLISREMMREFERPYTEKLFTQTGGGFFHNHTVGLYQADLVEETQGLLVQAFVNDPKCPTTAEALLDSDGAQREKILAASLQKPIQMRARYDELDDLLDVAKCGRFMLHILCEDEDNPAEVIQKVRKASNIA